MEDMKLLMSRPDYYGIEYEINPWMHKQHQVNHAIALVQWEALYSTVQQAGAEVALVKPAPGWPDMTFTANAGLLYQNKIILSHFKHPERQGEEPYFRDWFVNAGFTVLNADRQDNLAFEGAGDALAAGNTLFAGYGFRSQQNFYTETTYFDQQRIVYCELADPYFYHLDTCFCPLTEDLAIWYPPAFTPASQKAMAKEIRLVAVTLEEAKRFACNAVVLDRHVILPAQCPKLATELEHLDFIVHFCEMDEFLKAGGACKCLTLRIN